VIGVPRSLSAETAELPLMPEQLRAGACATGKYDVNLWSSTSPADRHAAARICRRRCPVIAICASFATSLPTTDTSVWGGMSAAQRRRWVRSS
jgi:Transcription factor WhiB